jgi:SAM-dependent methyltransferase
MDILAVVLFVVFVAFCTLIAWAIMPNNTVRFIVGGVELADDYYNVIPVHDATDDVNVVYNDKFAQSKKSYSHKKSKYRSWKSNSQINAIAKYGNADEFSRLCKLITRYFPYNERRNIIRDLYTKSDSEIYAAIKIDRGSERDVSQASELFRATTKLLTSKNIMSFPSDRYLDIGCGDGAITRLFAEYLGATDVHCIEPKKFASSVIKYHEPTPKLPFENGYFDVITAFMSLHHIPNIDIVAAELYRIMKSGGYLIIKEHDCWNPLDAMLVDIEHCIFINALEHKSTTNMDDVMVNYKNYFGWDEILKPFKYIHGDYYYNKLHHEINPTRTYIAVYKK